MNMKNAMILLIFFLAILGLVVGVYYTEEVNNDNTQKSVWERLYEDNGDTLTITLEKNDEISLDKFFT